MEDGRMTEKSTLPHLYWSIIINFFCNTFKRCDFTFFSKTFSSLAFQSNKSKTLTHFKIIIKTILLNNSWHLEKTVYLVIKPNRLESVWENIKFTLCPWQNNYSYCSACNQYEISKKKNRWKNECKSDTYWYCFRSLMSMKFAQ